MVDENRKSGGSGGFFKCCALVVIVVLLLGLIFSILTCSGVLSKLGCSPNNCDCSCTCTDCSCNKDDNPTRLSWEEESRSANANVSYINLTRSNQDYIGQKVLLTGKVISLDNKGNDSFELIVDISESASAGWQVLLVYQIYKGDPRVSEGNSIEFIATVLGTTSTEGSAMPKLEVILLRIL